jgi:hypothetical protein
MIQGLDIGGYLYFDQPHIEKQGHKWALTSFAREAWGSTKEELQTNGGLT